MSLEEIKQLEPNGLKVVDLFCGAGIGAYGIKKSGYEILYSLDNDPYAVETYNLNIGNHAKCGDIRNIKGEDLPECDLLVATPVCKPFSISGARRLTDDEKYGDLLAQTIRLFGEIKPKALFFENVKGLIIDDSLPIFLDFVKQLESFGYKVYWDVVNCYDLGAPQIRVRVFLVAIRNDIKHKFIPPKKLFLGKKTQRDAIWDLRDKTILDVKNHNVDNYRHYSFRVNVRQSTWDEPALTVMSHRDSVLLHPDIYVPYPDNDYINRYNFVVENNIRHMSVREHLRLQTVGDDFYFPDNISLNKQYERCSGIPSLIAYKYGNAIADCLLGKTPELQEIKVRKKLF